METESGKRSDRPKLATALSHAKAIGATLVFAKLDRPHPQRGPTTHACRKRRGLGLLRSTSRPSRGYGTLSAHSDEAGLISERTKAALAAAKARGVKLGNPNGARALRGKQTGNKEAVEAVQRRAQEHASNLRTIVEDIRAQGITSIRKIAEELNSRAILAPRGGEWQPTTVVRLLARLSV